MRRHLGLLALPVAFGALSLSSCSSSGSPSSGGTGSCPAYKNLCTTVPATAINAACGTNAVSVLPGSNSDTVQDVNTCDYQGPTGGSDVAVKAWTACFSAASNATLFYNGKRTSTALAGETKHDVSGLGDQAFYDEDLSSSDATLYVLKGAVLFYVQDNHAAGPADATLPCLSTIANQILAIK